MNEYRKHRTRMRALIAEARSGLPADFWGVDARAIAALADQVGADGLDEERLEGAPEETATWAENVPLLLEQIRGGYESPDAIGELMRCARVADIYERVMTKCGVAVGTASPAQEARGPNGTRDPDRAEREFQELAAALQKGELSRYSEATIDRILRDSGRDRGALRDLVATGHLSGR